jgi:hypothetical protein
MTAAHRHAARHELRAAKSLCVSRIRRGRYEPKGDMELVRLPSGAEISVEAKTRKRLPVLLTAALAQARRYHPDAIPAAVLSETGGQSIIALPLSAFRKLVGLASLEVPTQPSLLAVGAR